MVCVILVEDEDWSNKLFRLLRTHKKAPHTARQNTGGQSAVTETWVLPVRATSAKWVLRLRGIKAVSYSMFPTGDR